MTVEMEWKWIEHDSYDGVMSKYHQGYISYDTFERYMIAWWNNTFRYTDTGLGWDNACVVKRVDDRVPKKGVDDPVSCNVTCCVSCGWKGEPII